MPLDPNISLSYQPPQIQNPLSTLAQVQALKNQQLQSQSGQLELQQQQLNMQQQQAVMRAFANSGGDMDKALQEISTTAPLQYMALKSQQINLQKAYDEHAKATREDALYQNDMAGRDAQYVLDQKPEVRPYAYLTKRPGWIQKNPALEQQLPPTWDDSLEPVLQGIVARSQSIKDQAATQASKAATAVSEAELPGKKADSDTKAAKFVLYKRAVDEFTKNPQASDDIIDSVFPARLDANANATFKAARRNAMLTGGPDAADDVTKTAATHAASIAQAINPQVMTAEIQKAAAVARALVPIEVGKTIATEKAKAQVSPDAFAGIVDSGARTKASTEANLIDRTYEDKKGAADDLQTIIQQARAGNKGAGPLVAVATLRQQVNRVNRQELEAVQGAGSLWDRIQGKLGQLTEGKPIDESVLNDMENLSRMLAESARRTANSKITRLNQLYGAKVPLYDAQGGTGGGNAQQYKVGDPVMYQGKVHRVSAVDPQTGKLTLEP